MVIENEKKRKQEGSKECKLLHRPEHFIFQPHFALKIDNDTFL
jgi:hypothetical protein